MTLRDAIDALTKAEYYGNLARVAIGFAVSPIAGVQEAEAHAAYVYARTAWRWALAGEVAEVQNYIFKFDDGGEVHWNIEQAIKEVEAGHVFCESPIPWDEMVRITMRNEFDEHHVKDVDITVPCIGAPIFGEPGQIAYILIDGTHRVVKAVRLGKQVQSKLLTDEASLRCIMYCSAPHRIPGMAK